MARQVADRSTFLLSCRTLFLGGIFGYLLAVFALNSNSISPGKSSSLSATSAVLTQLQHRLLGHKASEYGDESSVSFSSLMKEELEEAENQGGAEHEPDTVTLDTAVAVIVFFLIALTILFEYTKEVIEEAADRIMKPVIQGLFGELTVLGFLSIVTFLVTKLGWFSKVSEHLFGEDEEDELLETFEFVHYMLFFIMVFFVINVLVLVYGGQAMEETWRIYDTACRDVKYMAHLDTLSSPEVRKTTYVQHLCETLFPCRSVTRRLRSELQLFRGLRQEFVLERSVKPPFAPHASNQVEEDFNFGRYLSICLGNKLMHMVHLSNYTWIFLGALTLVFYGLALRLDNSMENLSWIWASAGWSVFLAGNYFDYHMVFLLENMAGDHSSMNGLDDAGETGSLLASTLPAWTRIDLEHYLLKGRSMITQCCLPNKVTITRQDSLYWFERKGPKFYLLLFQMQMVFTAAYVSLLALSFIPFFLFEKSTESNLELYSYVIVSLLPVYLLLSKYHTAAANLTLACSIGVHRRPQAVSQVIREGKTDRIIRAMITMQKLQLAASSNFATTSENQHSNGTSSAASSLELEEVAQTFDALDISGDGSISSSELGAVLQALGVTATSESLATIVSLLDKDKDGSISRNEFLVFYKEHMCFDLGHDGLHELAKHLFEQIDGDGSGEITLSEFKNVVDSFNVGFSVDEIGNLVNELDEQDNGTIGEHEFVELLEKHDHLFEKIKLPNLE